MLDGSNSNGSKILSKLDDMGLETLKIVNRKIKKPLNKKILN